MPTVNEIRTAGTDLALIPRPIYEPLNAPSILSERLSRFGDDYNTSPNSNLYKLLLGLAGETGAGFIKKGMLYPRLQSRLESTHYDDLDRLYGSPIGLARLPEEMYQVDPRNQALTQDDWDDVFAKDARYRYRCLTWMRAVIAGGTPEGMALAAEAASGIECDVFEQYKYLDNARSDAPLAGMPNRGLTSSRNEFVVIPRTTSIPQIIHRQITTLIDRLRPVNTIPTVFVVNRTRTDRAARAVAATSSAFYVKRLVTGRSDINWPDPDPSKGLWIQTTEQEAPTFAWMDRQESITFLSIANVSASSTHIGAFNPMQKSLFPNLTNNIDPFYEYDASRSYASATVPIQITTPWTSRS